MLIISKFNKTESQKVLLNVCISSFLNQTMNGNTNFFFVATGREIDELVKQHGSTKNMMF